MALDSLAVLDAEFKKLDKQIADNKNYESEWSYTQLVKWYILFIVYSMLFNIFL